MNRIATTPGLYPLPDWAKETLSEQKGRQKSDLISGDEEEEVVETYDRARREVVETQQEASLDRIVEGQLRWDDMLCHPLAVHDAVETGGLVRYYDNNNFYREMVVTDELTPDGDVASELEAAVEIAPEAPLQAVLPGPYSLADLATDEHYGDADVFQEAVATFLAGEIEAFPDVETVFLLEPSLAVRPPDRLDSAIGAIDRVADAIQVSTSAESVLHPYWDAIPEDVYKDLLGTDVDALGYDLVTAATENESLVEEYGAPDAVSLGVVDGQNTRIESTDEIDERVISFADAAGSPETIYLSTNTEPFYLPVSSFEEKLHALAGAANKGETL